MNEKIKDDKIAEREERKDNELKKEDDKLSISIIIPIYKDLVGLDILLKRIENSLALYPHEIIVVNDYQEDNKKLEEMLNQYNKNYSKNSFRAINRPGKLGVASAILDGFNAASNQYVCTLNADLQHPPELLPTMIEELKKSDIVIASRYVDKGKIEKWSLSRKLISKWAIVLARFIPKVKQVKDPMSGYYALNKNVIKNKEIICPRNSSVATGFKLPLEILTKGDYNSVKEIPYNFSDRKSGKTNMGAYSIYTYFNQVIGLMYNSGEISRIGKFLVVGIIGSIINISILYLFTEKVFGGAHVLIAGFIASYLVSSVFAMESAIISNFILNEHWTFIDRRAKKDLSSVIQRGVKFNMCRLTGVGMNVIILFILTNFFHIYYIFSSVTAILIVTMWNYTTSTKLVWAENTDAQKCQ